MKGRPNPRKPRRNYRRIFEIPYYGSSMVVSVSDDINAARIRENAFLGEDKKLPLRCEGLTCWHYNRYGIFFNRDIDRGVLAHELFHVTHRILAYVGVKFTKKNHEPFAYLNQHLHECVNRALTQARIKINL